MKVLVYLGVGALIAIPLSIWLSPPWYASLAISVAVGMLVDTWLNSWWDR
jgi:hypothetical protein